MMTNKKLTLFVAFVALQLVVIGALFAQRLYTLSTGTEVVLYTVPVDPRDLIRGEYVALRYEISTISRYIAGDETLAVGDTVYVTLERGYQDAWIASRISKTQPSDYSVAIKGKVTSVTNGGAIWDGSGGKIGVEYGIERYFVEAGKGKELERSGRLKVFAKVDRAGAAVIERVEATTGNGLDGEMFEGETAPLVTPPATPPSSNSSDTRVKSNLASMRVSGELYFDRFGNYGEPFALATCPVSGGSIFFRDDRMRQAIAAVRANVTTSASVRCAAGGPGTEAVSSSWAVSAPLRSGGSWCVDSVGNSRAGVASGGGAQVAVCR